MLAASDDDPDSGETEAQFCLFYVRVLKEFYKMDYVKYQTGIRRSVQNIRQKQYLLQRETVPFHEESDRIAYVLAYGIIHSRVVYDTFLQILSKSPLIEWVKSLEEIKLCILGCGPALEVVAICRLLNDIAEIGVFEHPLYLFVTLIDQCGSWENDARFIVKLAEEMLCDKNVEIDIAFIEADLTKNFSKEVKRSIKDAHFVTMVKVLSDVSYNYELHPTECKTGLIYNVLKNMSRPAYLFYLDTAGGDTFEKINHMIDRSLNTVRIYGPSSHKVHILKDNTVQKFSDSFIHVTSGNKLKNYCVCTSRITISCSAWLKTRRSTLKAEERKVDLKNTHTASPDSRSDRILDKNISKNTPK